MRRVAVGFVVLSGAASMLPACGDGRTVPDGAAGPVDGGADDRPRDVASDAGAEARPPDAVDAAETSDATPADTAFDGGGDADAPATDGADAAGGAPDAGGGADGADGGSDGMVATEAGSDAAGPGDGGVLAGRWAPLHGAPTQSMRALA